MVNEVALMSRVMSEFITQYLIFASVNRHLKASSFSRIVSRCTVIELSSGIARYHDKPDFFWYKEVIKSDKGLILENHHKVNQLSSPDTGNAPLLS